jgi:hypothetical protein
MPLNASASMLNFEGNTIPIVPGYGQKSIFMCDTENEKDIHKSEACRNWVQAVRNATGRSLLLLNNGAAYHSEATFRAMFDGLLGALDSGIAGTKERNDLVWFRSVSPAHNDCMNATVNVGMVKDYADYERRYKTSKWAWDKFALYNAYVKQRLEERKRTVGDAMEKQQHVELLNIYNMTALRGDGHIAASDCLHYEHPGPVDWWNHLMYSNLLDVAKREREAMSAIQVK